MRHRSIRVREDAEQVAEVLKNAEVEWITVEQARMLVRMRGRPISTNIREALGILANEGRIVPLCNDEMIQSVPEKTVQFRYGD